MNERWIGMFSLEVWIGEMGGYMREPPYVTPVVVLFLCSCPGHPFSLLPGSGLRNE